MEFSKAAQLTTKSPEYEKLVEMTLIHKAASKKYFRTRKALEGSTDPAAQLQLYRAKDEYSLVCKTLKRIQNEFAKAKIRLEMEKHGMRWDTIEPLQLSRMMNIDIPLSMKDILAEERKRTIVRSMSTEQFEDIKKAALEYVNRGKTVDEDDPTLDDFEPLPVDEEEKGA